MDRAPTSICEFFETRLDELLGLDGEGGELDLRAREELLDHGRACEACARNLQSYRATVDLLRQLPRNTAPTDFLAWAKASRPQRGS